VAAVVRDGAPCCGCCTLPEALGTHDGGGGDDDGLRLLLHAVVARVEEAWVPCPAGADLPPLPHADAAVVVAVDGNYDWDGAAKVQEALPEQQQQQRLRDSLDGGGDDEEEDLPGCEVAAASHPGAVVVVDRSVTLVGAVADTLEIHVAVAAVDFVVVVVVDDAGAVRGTWRRRAGGVEAPWLQVWWLDLRCLLFGMMCVYAGK
jgi:hypothetical protein